MQFAVYRNDITVGLIKTNLPFKASIGITELETNLQHKWGLNFTNKPGNVLNVYHFYIMVNSYYGSGQNCHCSIYIGHCPYPIVLQIQYIGKGVPWLPPQQMRHWDTVFLKISRSIISLHEITCLNQKITPISFSQRRNIRTSIKYYWYKKIPPR